MPRTLIYAAAVVILSAGSARAQYSGPYAYQDNNNVGFPLITDYEGKRSYADTERDRQIERDYRQVVTRIPDRKPSNDPWKNVRPAATASAADRHRPQ
jgi:hypothetical protein